MMLRLTLSKMVRKRRKEDKEVRILVSKMAAAKKLSRMMRRKQMSR